MHSGARHSASLGSNGSTPHAIISENKYPLRFFVWYVHPVTQQHKSRTVGKVCLYQSSHYEKCGYSTVHPMASYHLVSISLLFNSLHSSMNQELCEKNLCNQGSHYKKYTPLCKGSHRVPTTKSTLFTVSKDEWNTKEDTGKSLKKTLHVLPKCTSYFC